MISRTSSTSSSGSAKEYTNNRSNNCNFKENGSRRAQAQEKAPLMNGTANNGPFTPPVAANPQSDAVPGSPSQLSPKFSFLSPEQIEYMGIPQSQRYIHREVCKQTAVGRMTKSLLA